MCVDQTMGMNQEVALQGNRDKEQREREHWGKLLTR